MKSSTSPFRSNFYLWNGVSAIFFSNCVTNTHSHNTLQIITDIHHQFRCRVNEAPWLTCKNLIIKQDTPHQLDTNDSVQLIIYLDTATTAAKSITARYLRNNNAAEPELNLFDLVRPDDLQQVLLKPDPHSLHNIVAINRIMTGSPINDAAWEPGFSDNSHFHKILVTMFGISPSQFLRDSKTMEIFTCDFSPLHFETTVYDANGHPEKIYK